MLSRLRTLLPEPVYLTFRRFSDSETSHFCNRMFCSIGLVEKIKLPQKCDSPVPRASAVHGPADRAGGVVGQGGLHVQGQGGLDLLHGGEHRDEEHGNGRHKQVYITIIIIIVFMVIIIVFFIVYYHQHRDERQFNQRFTNAKPKLST